MHSFTFSIVITCIFNSYIAFGHSDDIYTIQYNVDNFQEELVKKNHFVMFYAPWCGHCKRLGPTWEQLAEMLNEKDSNIVIAKVDCTTDKQICADQDVTGYPTLKFFKKGQEEGVKFRGSRDLPTLTTFINEQLGEDNEEKLDDISTYGLIELTDKDFQEHIKEGKHFIKFYAPWCGHCQQLAPIWQELAKTYEFDSSISIAKIDCTKYASMCSIFEIKAYPSLLWIENGEKIDQFRGSRAHEDLVTYVKKMLDGEPLKKEEAIVTKDKSQTVGQEISEITADNFRDKIQTGVTFIKFFAPWCGHCKSLAPTWENLRDKYKASSNIHIGRVDCTVHENKALCNEEEVNGFPTIYLYKNGERISEYSGSRTLEDLSDFVEGHVGHDEL